MSPHSLTIKDKIIAWSGVYHGVMYIRPKSSQLDAFE